MEGGKDLEMVAVFLAEPRKPEPPQADPETMGQFCQFLRRNGVTAVFLPDGEIPLRMSFAGGGDAIRVQLYKKGEAVGEVLGDTDAVFFSSRRLFVSDYEIMFSELGRSNGKAFVALKYLADAKGYVCIGLDGDGNAISEKSASPASREGYVIGAMLVPRSAMPQRMPKADSLEKLLSLFPSAAGIPFPGPFFLGEGKKLPKAEPFSGEDKAVFLDRDGIINVDKEYVHLIEDIEFQDGIFPFCRRIQERGYKPVVVTNQAGVAKGFFPEEDIDRLHSWMKREFQKHDVDILDFFYCPHHPEGVREAYRKESLCRKPNPGMLLAAAEKWGIDLTKSFMVGDKPSDRIRLPYLKSLILKGERCPQGFDCESFDELADRILAEADPAG